MLCCDRPDSVAGTSRMLISRSGSWPFSSTVTEPSRTVIARPPRSSDSRIAGASDRSVKTHGLALVPLRIAHTRGSSPLSTAQPRGLGGLRDDGLDLGELVDGVDPLHAQVVGRDVGDDADVVGGDAHPLEQHPAPGGLEDAELDPGSGQHAARTCRAGVVACLDDLALHHDAVGRGPGRPQAGRHADVAEQPRRRGLAVGAGDRRHGDLRLDDRRTVTGLGAPDHQPLLLDHVVTVEPGLQHRADALAERARPGAAPPYERHHDRLAARCPDGRARPAGWCRSPSASRRTARSTRRMTNRWRCSVPGAPGTRAAHAHPGRQGGERLLVGREVARQLEAHLDRRLGEVEVGPLEDPDLRHRRRRAAGGLGLGDGGGRRHAASLVSAHGRGRTGVTAPSRGRRRRRGRSRPSWPGTSRRAAPRTPGLPERRC